MSMSIKGYIVAGALVLVGIAGLGGYIHGIKHERGRAASEELKLLAVEERAIKAAAGEIAKLKIIHRTNTQVLEREIVNNPLPDTCRLSDDGLRALNAIIEGRALPATGSELPEADAAP
jgi:hypothetical protein